MMMMKKKKKKKKKKNTWSINVILGSGIVEERYSIFTRRTPVTAIPHPDNN